MSLNFSTFSVTLFILFCFYTLSHLSSCEVLWFWFEFPWWLNYSASLHVFINHLYIFLKKYLFKSFVHFKIRLFLFLLLNYKGYIFFLDKVYILIIYLIWKYFLLFYRFFFTILTMSFKIQFFSKFNNVKGIYSFFCHLSSWYHIQEINNLLKVRKICFFKNFMASVFTFKCMIHFEITFVYGMKYLTSLLHVDVQIFQHQTLVLFPYWIVWAPSLKINWP